MKVSKYITMVEQMNGDRLVHSGLSGAVLNVARKDLPEFELLLNGESPDTGDPLVTMAYETVLSALRRSLFLIDDNIDELDLLRSRYYRSKHSCTFTSLSIAPTMKCNLACPYCYNPRDKPMTMDRETIDRTVTFVGDHLKMSRDTGTPLGITWIGGEPLAAFGAMTELAERIRVIALEHGRDIVGSLVTNGTLLTEDTAARLGGRPYFVRNVQITVDGPQAKHDASRCFPKKGPTYDRICKGIRLAKKHGLTVMVRINADAFFEIKDFERLMDEMYRRGVVETGGHTPSFYLARIHSHAHDTCKRLRTEDRVLSVKDYATLLVDTVRLARKRRFPCVLRTFQEPRRIGCGVVQENGFTVDPEGRLGKCWHAVGSEEYCVGRVGELLETMNGEYRRWQDYDPFKNEMCRQCQVLPLCMGGCAEAHMRVGGMIDEPCIPEKHNLREALLLRYGRNGG